MRQNRSRRHVMHMLLGIEQFKENLNWHLRQGFMFHPVVCTQWNQTVYDETLLFFRFVNFLIWGALYATRGILKVMKKYFFHSKENNIEGKQLLTISTGSFKQFLFLYLFVFFLIIESLLQSSVVFFIVVLVSWWHKSVNC